MLHTQILLLLLQWTEHYVTQTGHFRTLLFCRVCSKNSGWAVRTAKAMPCGLQTGIKPNSLNIGELDSKLLFKKAGDAAVLELTHLHSTPGLNVGRDPVMIPLSSLSEVFDGEVGLLAG